MGEALGSVGYEVDAEPVPVVVLADHVASYGEVGVAGLGNVVGMTQNGSAQDSDGDGEGYHTPDPSAYVV
ncbi:MAG TPA: hypothetical protein VMB52_03940 [Verrucomicrobiae bacterium]|nr:hypothetical protein [Verrucomicrobiae bacterium]